jgi:hypothetical protein
MSLIRWRAASRVLLAAACLPAWVGIGAVTAMYLSGRSQPYETWVATLMICFIGIGGLVPFWNLRAQIDFYRRGYRIREVPPRLYLFHWPLGPRPCLFEEMASNGEIRQLPFTRLVLTGGYPAQSEVPLPDSATWDRSVPSWARGRRTEIVERMTECLGGSGSATRIVEIT